MSIILSSFYISLQVVGASSSAVIRPRFNYSPLYWIKASIPIFVYTFIEGFRNDVGVDFKQNKYIFQYLQQGRLYRTDIDPLYLWVNKTLVFLGFEYPMLFILTSFLFIFSIYFLLRDKPYLILFALPMYLLYSLYAENLIRQFFSAALLIIGISYLLKNKFLEYSIICTIAFFIHSSALIAILIYSVTYFLAVKQIKPKIYLTIGVYVFCWIIGTTIFEQLRPLVMLFSYLGIMSNYTDHVDALLGESRLDLYFTASVYGNAFHFIRNLGLIILGHGLLKKYQDRQYLFFYLIFIFYACAKPMFYRQELFDRLVHYFEILLPVLFAYIGFDIFFGKHQNKLANKFNRYFILALIAFNIYSYYGGIENNAKVMKHEFLFIWDK